MQTPDNNLQVQNQRSDEDEINLMDIMLVIAKYNRFIMAFNAVSIVLALIYVMLQPFSYTAKTVILAPQPKGESSVSALLGNLNGLGGAMATGGLGLKNPSEISLGILKSRTLADRIIIKHDLQKHYNTKSMAHARKILSGSSQIVLAKNGFITVEYTHSDPEMAAKLANAYAEELNLLNAALAIADAESRRLFYEKQIKAANISLSQAEYAMKETQSKTGWYEFGGFDISSAVGSSASGSKINSSILLKAEELRAEINFKEIDLANKRAYMTEQNPEYIRSLVALAALKASLGKLQGKPNNPDTNEKVTVRQLSDTGFAYMHQVRDLKYKQGLLEFYSKQFEMAKMDEVKESPEVQVIDKAIPPEERSAPKRGEMMVMASSIAFLISMLLVFIMNSFDTAKQNSISAERLNLLRRYLQRGK